MVTWLQTNFFLVIGMGLSVTNTVTKWLHGYKGIKRVQTHHLRFKSIKI